MSATYYAVVTIHVLTALFWLGGMSFIAIIGAPLLRSVQPPELRQRLFRDLGLRFRTAGWIAIAILIVTGVINLHYRGWLQWDGVWASSAFWHSGVGHSLACKLIAVTAMVAVSAVHDFILGPAAGRQTPGSPRAIAFRRHAAHLARANAVLGIIIVIAAVRLARGG
ncbi:MAG TPA: CopD family protein [Gemmatimonadaceae bacterium]|nr:CopD family protein [Gemmatimonadaceae bacterium]